MGINDNKRKEDQKDLVLPPIGKHRTEVLCFMEGVEWLLTRLATFKFVEYSEHNSDALAPIFRKSFEEAQKRYPLWEEFPPATKG